MQEMTTITVSAEKVELGFAIRTREGEEVAVVGVGVVVVVVVVMVVAMVVASNGTQRSGDQ